MTKLFTIVKDEVDVIEDWIIYHGCMFGWNNIFVIDNFSSDGTWEKINEFKDLISIFREPDYSKKGDYMRHLINVHCHEGEIAFPIDIDEFVVYYDRPNNIVYSDRELINNYINNLPPCTLYKANYIQASISKPEGYEKATNEINHGIYIDMGNLAKTFFNTSYYKGHIDHGNHINSADHHLTNICLVHYHYRNIEQMKKKILNNVQGLGYQNNLDFLKNTINTNPNCNGNHHVRHQINVLENTFSLPLTDENSNGVCITPLKEQIKKKYY